MSLNYLLLAGYMGSSAEHEAKVAVLRFLIEEGSLSQGAVILNEYSANFSGIRADFAVLQSDELHGIEIKSEADSLTRLERQLEGYRRCFSSVTIALAAKHLTNARKVLPYFVGILVIDDGQVSRIRKPKSIRRRKLDVIRSLPKFELFRFLKQNGVLVASGLRSELESAAQHFSLQTILKLFADYIQRVYGRYSNELRACKSSDVQYAHVQRLSRFKVKRDRAKMLHNKRLEIFKNWQGLLAAEHDLAAISPPNHHQHLFAPVQDSQNTAADASVD